MLTTPEVIAETSLHRSLSEAVPRWLRDVPLYREWDPEAWMDNAARARLPFITKQDIRENFPHNFLPPGSVMDDLVDAGEVELEHTSGTSEARTPLILPAGWWLEQEARALRLNPVVAAVLDAEPNARRATISSPVCNSEVCYTGVPSAAARSVGSTRFLSLSRFPFLWSEADLARMAGEALEWQPRFLDVDPVYAVVFALYCERRGIRLPSLRFIIATYEFVSRAHKRILERAFGVPVFNLYGSTETGHLLMELPDGSLCPSHGTAALELVEVDGRGVGELVVTTASNEFMPLIRYRIGDLARRTTTPLATRYEIHGRAKDAMRAADGSRFTAWDLDLVAGAVPGIAHYQAVQSERSLLVRFVPDHEPPAPAALAEVSAQLRASLGLEVTIEPVQTLLAESSGKFRLMYPL